MTRSLVLLFFIFFILFSYSLHLSLLFFLDQFPRHLQLMIPQSVLQSLSQILLLQWIQPSLIHHTLIISILQTNLVWCWFTLLLMEKVIGMTSYTCHYPLSQKQTWLHRWQLHSARPFWCFFQNHGIDVMTWLSCGSWTPYPKKLQKSVLYSKTAKEIWTELEDHFGQSNGAQLYHLQKELTDQIQGNLDIPGYYTKIKRIWDELDALNTCDHCTCSCGGK